MRAWLQEEKRVIAVEIEQKYPMNVLTLNEAEKEGLNESDIQTLEQRKTDDEQQRVTELREMEEANMLKHITENIEAKTRLLVKLESPEKFKSDVDTEDLAQEKSFMR
jgi:hypothetical protein